VRIRVKAYCCSIDPSLLASLGQPVNAILSIGLHDEGYGLLLQQCTFSAGIMYALWVSLERSGNHFKFFKIFRILILLQ
jgi:hypothetical protein